MHRPRLRSAWSGARPRDKPCSWGRQGVLGAPGAARAKQAAQTISIVRPQAKPQLDSVVASPQATI